MASLPYLAATGSIKTALERIAAAATPDRVTVDFVKTKLQIRGGTGSAILPYLKKIGFVNSDGTPTDLYKRFRNKATAGAAVAQAVKIGYKELENVNEYFFELPDSQLRDLIVQVTGAEAKSTVAKLTLQTLKTLKSCADFETPPQLIDQKPAEAPHLGVPAIFQHAPSTKERVGMNLSYTINLNLPATSDQAVFNAIFRSLKEHLIPDD